MTGFRIKLTNVKIKDGKVIPQPAYASVADKLKRGDRKKIVRGKRVK